MGQAERALPRSLLTDVDQEALQLRLTAAQRDTAIVSAAVPLEMRAELERRAQKADRSLSSEIRATADRLRTAIGRGCKAAGVPLFSPHDLRHRRISLLHAQGRSWAEVARFVGQKKLSITADTYTHVMSDGCELDDGALWGGHPRKSPHGMSRRARLAVMGPAHD